MNYFLKSYNNSKSICYFGVTSDSSPKGLRQNAVQATINVLMLSKKVLAFQLIPLIIPSSLDSQHSHQTK